MAETALSERALRLISLAIVFDVDSEDVMGCCERHGLNYDQSEIDAIRRAVLEDYGLPGMFPPRPVNWA